VSSPSHELMNPITHTSHELVPAHLSCSPPSLSLVYSLAKSIDNYVITDPTNDSRLVDIEKEQLERGTIEFDSSLGNSRWYSCSINSYDFYLEELPKSIVVSSLDYY